MQSDTILVTGACGQIGSELVLALRKIHPNVIASDLKDPIGELIDSGPFERLDVLHKPGLDAIVKKTLSVGGTITGEHGVGLAKKPWLKQQLGDASYELMRQIKKSLDPQNLLNPGKIFDLP